MEKFKKGDLVKVTGNWSDLSCSLIGTEQVIDSAGQDGYKFVDDDHELCHIKDEHLTLIRRANMFKKGDILESDYSFTLEVLETLGEVIFTKESINQNATLWTAQELQKAGWTLKTETETKELTIDEIADKFGLKPEQVHIKKGD